MITYKHFKHKILIRNNIENNIMRFSNNKNYNKNKNFIIHNKLQLIIYNNYYEIVFK